jgi:ribosomal protein S18 acetylase RimI-like enzyme
MIARTIRDAESRDIDTLYKMGIVEEGFAVSPHVRFYEKDYLKDWVENPDNDILLVSEMSNEIVWFLFCRLNRNAWAMLENIAVNPSVRRQGVGTALLEECLRRLRVKGIKYIASIVRVQ